MSDVSDALEDLRDELEVGVVEIEGVERPAFVTRWISAGASWPFVVILLALAAFFILLQPVESPPPGQLPVTRIVGVALVGLAFAVPFFARRASRQPRGLLALVESGVYVDLAPGRMPHVLIPWGSIAEARARRDYPAIRGIPTAQTSRWVLRFQAREGAAFPDVRVPWIYQQMCRSRRGSLEIDVDYLRAPAKTLEHCISYYLAHPERRAEIGTEPEYERLAWRDTTPTERGTRDRSAPGDRSSACSGCGAALGEASRFCGRCGRPRAG